MTGIAKRLSERFGGEFKAVRCGFGWEYVRADGLTFTRCAESVMDYDGWSDTRFYVIYESNRGDRCHTGEVVTIR